MYQPSCHAGASVAHPPAGGTVWLCAWAYSTSTERIAASAMSMASCMPDASSSPRPITPDTCGDLSVPPTSVTITLSPALTLTAVGISTAVPLPIPSSGCVASSDIITMTVPPDESPAAIPVRVVVCPDSCLPSSDLLPEYR